MALTTTTTAAAASTAIILNPVAKSTTFQLSESAVGSSGAALIQVSLDDPTITPVPTQVWTNISTAAAPNSSNIEATGYIYTVLSPLAAARINSTANTSAVFVLKAIQSITA